MEKQPRKTSSSLSYIWSFIKCNIFCYKSITDVKSSIDAFGVETSSAPFMKQPTLYQNVLEDLYGNKKNHKTNKHHNQDKDENLEKRIRRAEQLLAADMLVNKKLNNTWYLAKEQRPYFNSVRILHKS